MRLQIADLLPGTDYAVQVRATRDGLASEWSERFLFTTDQNLTMPAAPATVTWVVSGDSFLATWSPVTLDMNGDPAMIIGYELEFTAGATVKVVPFGQLSETNMTYTLTFPVNVSLFGTAQPSVSFRVRAVNNKNVRGTWSGSIAATNAVPDAPTSVNATGIIDGIKIEWVNSTADDVVGYNIYIGTSTAPTTKVATTTSNPYTYSTLSFVQQYVRIRAVDKFGQESAYSNEDSATPESPFGTDSTPPAAPTALAYSAGWDSTLQTAHIDVAWTNSVDSDVDHYEVRWSPTSGTNWRYRNVPHDQSGTRLDGLTPGTAYYVDVRAVDRSANVSGWVNEAADYPITTIADTTAPSTPATPTASVGVHKIQVIHNGLKAAGGAMEPDVSHYEVYASTSNGFTTYNSTTMLGTMQNGPAIIETFNIPASAGSGTTQTWYVKVIAVDKTGNKSAASAQVTAAVGLIETANIGDAQITTAKIQSLEVNKLTAGTGLATDFTIKSTLTLGESGNDGVIQSYDFGTSGGTAGFSLDSDGLIVKTGAIEAAALKIQQGANLITPDYAGMEFPSSYYFPGSPNDKFFPNSANHVATIGTDGGKFDNQYLKVRNTALTTGFPVVYFAGATTPNPTNFKMNYLEPGKTYIFSGYFRNPTSVSTNVRFIFRSIDSVNATTDIEIFPYTALTAGSTWQRLSGPVTIPANYVSGTIFTQTNTNTDAAGYDVDGIQIEQKIGSINTPSTWNPPGSTLIDGGMIRTGEIRSATDLTLNGITMPTWAIDLQGDAQFGNLLIRGSAVVGGAEEEGALSLVQSYNYDPSVDAGWIIRSDGVAEFRQVTANTFDGQAIKANTVDVDTLTSSSLTKKITLGGGSALVAEGTLGEEVSLSADGFRVFGPDEVAVTNKQLLTNVATITTALPHGMLVGSPVILVGVGSPFDGEHTITSVTTSEFTFDLIGTDVTSVASTGVARGKDTTGINSGPKYIEFPTDGTQPNIISGTLTASTLVVTDGASFAGTTSIENDGVFTIASAIIAPKTAPVVSIKYNDKTLSGNLYTPYGATKGHDGHIYVMNNGGLNKRAITKHNASTGEHMATYLHFTTPMTIYVTGLSITYSPNYNVYYVLTSTSSQLGTSHSVGVYDTTFALVGQYTVDNFTNQYTVPPAIGWDYVNNRLLLAFKKSSTGTLNVTSYTMDVNGVPLSANSTVEAASSTNVSAPAFIAYGAFDNNVNSYVYKDRNYWSGSSYRSHYVHFNLVGALFTNLQFPVAYSTGVYGAWWDTTANKFYDIGSTNGIREYQGGDSMIGRTWTVTNKALTSNVATITTSAAHDLLFGDTVTVAGVDATFNGTFRVTGVPTTTTFTYAKTAANVASTASGGTAVGTMAARHVAYAWYDSVGTTHETNLSPVTTKTFVKRAALSVTISSIPGRGSAGADAANQARIYVAHDSITPTGAAGTTFRLRNTITYPSTTANIDPNQVIPSTVPSPTNGFTTAASNPGIIQSTTGNSFWKGDDTAQFYQLILTSSFEAGTGNTPATGSTPALRIGSTGGSHLRVDSNEIYSMTGPSTQGVLFLNSGGAVQIGGKQLSGFFFGKTSITTNASGQDTITHNCGGTPTIVLAMAEGTTVWEPVISNYTTSQFTVTLRSRADNSVAGSGISPNISWVAFRT